MESTQSLIKQACNDSGISFRGDYSGRGMFGSKCIGIVGDLQGCMGVLNEVIRGLTQQLFETAIDCADGEEQAAYDLNDTVQDAITTLLGFETDNMGRSSVIMYWPNLEPLAEDTALTDEWIEQQSEQTLLLWVRENREYHTDEDSVENHGALVDTVKLMRDRMAEDVE